MHKKGISPLIAIVLLIVFTVAISTLIVAWMYDYTKNTTDAASSGTTGRGGVVSCANQIIAISDVSVTPNTVDQTQFNDSTSSKTFKCDGESIHCLSAAAEECHCYAECAYCDRAGV